MTPCYYCDIRSVGTCKTCIHSDTYEEPTTLKELTDEEIEQLANENLGDSFDCDIMWMRMFVKAILKKAQEK